MAKQLTKKDFIKIAERYGYTIDGRDSNYIAIFLNNERGADNLLAYLDVSESKGGVYNLRLCSDGHIVTIGASRNIVSKEALENHLKRTVKDLLYLKRKYKLKQIQAIGRYE